MEAATDPRPVDFSVGETIVHPAHGVGRIAGIGEETIAGECVGLILIDLQDRNLRVKVPLAKARALGLRRLASRVELDEALDVVSQRPRVARGLWTRRAADYAAKINSGQPRAIAEVVRDLRAAGRSATFSERQILERAIDRLSSEMAALDGTDRSQARCRLVGPPVAA
jgi:CarD family transcriptional regulator